VYLNSKEQVLKNTNKWKQDEITDSEYSLRASWLTHKARPAAGSTESSEAGAGRKQEQQVEGRL